MSAREDEPVRPRLTAAIFDAHLEFLVDGEGDWFAYLDGAIVHSDHTAIGAGSEIEIRLGAFAPLVLGFHSGPSGASATATLDSDGMASLKALLSQVRPDGPSLVVELTVMGDPQSRAGGRTHSWPRCSVAPKLSYAATPARPPQNTPDFDADLRIEVPPANIQTSPERFDLSGAVTASRRDTLVEGLRVHVTLAEGVERGFQLLDGAVHGTWPLKHGDADGIEALLSHAGGGPVFVDLDLGQAPLSDDVTRWSLTDIGLIAPSVLSPDTHLRRS